MVFDEKCGSTHNVTALSIFSAASSGLLFLFTVPLNGIILLCLTKNVISNKAKYKLFFYKIIINIAIADLMKGLFADGSAFVWHLRETYGVGSDHEEIDVPFVHVSIFVTDGVALVSMAILSLERILALLTPHFQFSKCTQMAILLASWPISVCIFLPYYFVGFMIELVIFFSCTNSIAVVSLVLLTVIYRIKFKAPYTRNKMSGSFTSSMTNLSGLTNDTALSEGVTTVEKDENTASKEPGDGETDSGKPRRQRCLSVPCKRRTTSTLSNESQTSSTAMTESVDDKVDDADLTLKRRQLKNGLSKADPIEIARIEKTAFETSKSNAETGKDKRKRKRSTSLTNIAILALPFQRTSSSTASMRMKQSKKERKVTLAFLKMLLVFIVTYLPTLVIIIFLNSPNRNCETTHILRDLSVLGILSSSLFRAINFLTTLKHVRKSTRKMFKQCGGRGGRRRTQNKHIKKQTKTTASCRL